MLVETDFHHLAASLLYNHGDAALTYALRNARVVHSQDQELEAMWMRVARKIEHLISIGVQDQQNANA